MSQGGGLVRSGPDLPSMCDVGICLAENGEGGESGLGGVEGAGSALHQNPTSRLTSEDVQLLMSVFPGPGGKTPSLGGPRTRGPSGRVSIEKYLEKRWDKATFPSVSKSVAYHVGKHGKGLSAIEYTQRAEMAFRDPAAGRASMADLQGRAAVRVQSDYGSGLFTPHGKIIWFHPR